MKVGKTGIILGVVAVVLSIVSSVFSVSFKVPGPQGETGKSAYELAVSNGFKGTIEEWELSLKGEKGDQGLTGAQGEQGLQGEQGVQGEKGDQGEQGLQGEKGDQGEQGIQGEQGEKGDKGDKGDQGLTGAQGEQGIQGEKGDKGDKGDAGKDGRTVEFRLNGDWIQWKYTDEAETEWKNLYQKGDTPLSVDVAKVSFSLGGGVMPSGTPEYIYVTPGASVVLPTPSKQGYTFLGWYKSGENYPVSETYRVHESIVLTAKWEAGAVITGKKIYDLSDLFAIADNLGGTYCLMNDIDCGGLAINAIGDATNGFTGLIEGQGYTISNLIINGTENVGLIGYNNGTIRNLKIENAKVNVTSATSSGVNAGILVGYNVGKIQKCSVTNSDVTVTVNYTRNGGLIAGANGGKIENCYAFGNVIVDQTDRSQYDARSGGITGVNNGTISNCMANAVVSAYSAATYSNGYAGIICGGNGSNATIENCLLFGTVQKANNKAGDVAGLSYGTINNCYKGEDLSILVSSPNLTATAMTRTNLSNANFYKLSLKWDMSIWNVSNVNLEDYIYPTLIYNF